MLTTLGRGLSPAAARHSRARRFHLTSALPPEIGFTRASGATCINHDGCLVSAANNVPRFDHAGAGRKLGLLIEPATTNKNSNYNANPTATTSFSTSGDAGGTLSVVDDAAALQNAGLHLVCTTGNVFRADNSAGSTNYIVSLPGTTGNTNKHSASIYLRSPHSGTVCSIALNGTAQSIMGDATYRRYKHENQTPASSSQRTVLTVPAGKTVYFILYQLEENTCCTSTIVTTGSTAARSADRAFIDNIHLYPWYNATEGYIALRYYLPGLNTADSFLAVLHDGTAANTIGLRQSSTDHDLLAYIRSSSANLFNTSNDDTHVAGMMNGGGITWKADEAMIMSGGRTRVSSLTGLPPGITRLEIGARNGGAAPLQGHIPMMEVGHGYLDPHGLGAKFQDTSDIAIACGGQSLMGGHFRSQASDTDAGRREHCRILGAALPERIITLANGSTGGSAASKTSHATLYWWDPATQTPGPMLHDFFDDIDAAGILPTAILWSQGEADSHEIGGVTSRTQYKQCLEAIFTAMRTRLGPLPVFIQRIGRRGSGFTNTGGVQAVREVQAELIAAHAWCHDAGETYDLPLHDQVHLSDAGYVAAAARNAHAILPLFDHTAPDRNGPRIAHAARSGTTLTVTLAHDDAGSDFSPTSAIDGFVFTDNTTPITITSAVRSDSHTVTLTLGSLPTSGIETLYYGYDDMLSIGTANIVRDNSAQSTCLRTTKISL